MYKLIGRILSLEKGRNSKKQKIDILDKTVSISNSIAELFWS